LLGHILERVGRGVECVFLNQVDLAPLAGALRAKLGPRVKIVLLSHGLESADYLHVLRARGAGTPFGDVGRSDLTKLGRLLVTESLHRQHIDQVFTLAPFEAEIERWLGARQVDWLPRTVTPCPLEWAPGPGRLGYVGTLNHPPNSEGLLLLLRALAAAPVPGQRIRLVGGPADAAQALTRAFPFVDYLGPLPDAELRAEAATWTCFLHPLFCYARGCSTKLAVALGWQIPVVTTAAGVRGYRWREGELPVADTPGELARLLARLADPEVARASQREVCAVARSSPTLEEVAAQVRSALPEPVRRNDSCVSC
jgi:hypothetical protein